MKYTAKTKQIDSKAPITIVNVPRVSTAPRTKYRVPKNKNINRSNLPEYRYKKNISAKKELYSYDNLLKTAVKPVKKVKVELKKTKFREEKSTDSKRDHSKSSFLKRPHSESSHGYAYKGYKGDKGYKKREHSKSQRSYSSDNFKRVRPDKLDYKVVKQLKVGDMIENQPLKVINYVAAKPYVHGHGHEYHSSSSSHAHGNNHVHYGVHHDDSDSHTHGYGYAHKEHKSSSNYGYGHIHIAQPCRSGPACVKKAGYKKSDNLSLKVYDKFMH